MPRRANTYTMVRSRIGLSQELTAEALQPDYE
jgi:hypothetical protein